jgi:hemerythrin-like domain-containing protein
MSQSLEAKDLVGFQNAAKQYRDLLRGHITKENFVLFMIADQVIDEESQEQMFEDFELFEETVVGHGVHEELHAMIDTWAEAFGMG